MNLERFLAERAPQWTELQQLVDRSGVGGSRLSPVEVRRLGALYRGAAADLAAARRSHPEALGTARLASLVSAANAVVYGRSRRTETLRTFVSTSMWRGIRATGPCLLLAVGLTVGFAALGSLWALADPSAAAGILPGAVNPHPGQGGLVHIALAARSGVATEIFTNNIGVAFLALAGGFTLGLLTGYLIAYNSAVLGALGTLEAKDGQFSGFARLVLPHGILELSCIAVAGAAGFCVARALISPGNLRRSQALRAQFATVGDAIVGVSLALVVAGLTEGIVTTSDPSLPLALAIGLALGAAFWALVLWRGRPATPEPAGVPTRPPSVPPSALAPAGPPGLASAVPSGLPSGQSSVVASGTPVRGGPLA